MEAAARSECERARARGLEESRPDRLFMERTECEARGCGRLSLRSDHDSSHSSHLVLDRPDVLLDLGLPKRELERLPLRPARARHRRDGAVLVPPSHRPSHEPGVY